MKTLLAFLFLAVSVTLAVEGPGATPAAQPNDRDGDPWPNICCFEFMKRPIPRNLLKSFEYTSGRCSKPGVIFITKRGQKICADPFAQWVQDRIHDLSPP
ncbi:C-C motif chemokine 3-like [Vipera latastei]